MPPIYDDYIHESGFGEVMTLFCDEYDILVPKVLMRIFIMMKACLLFMMIIFMKVDLERS